MLNSPRGAFGGNRGSSHVLRAALLIVAIAAAPLALPGCMARYSREAHYDAATLRGPAGRTGGERGGRLRPQRVAALGAVAGKRKDATNPTTPAAKPTVKGQRQERLVIYTALLTLSVFKPRQVIEKARVLGKDAGGWMQSMSNSAIVLRVPAAKLEGLLSRLAELGEVLSRDIRGRDVTAAFYDLQIRLQNAIRVRKRLLALLEQSKNVKESVAVEKELGRVTEMIERFKGRLKFLKNRISFSTITLRVRRKSAWGPRRRRLPFGWLRQLGLGPILRADN